MDKRLAKKTDAILFAKIENDGYHLGAQRRPIDHNDLPAAVRNIKGWLESVRNGTVFDVASIANLSLVAKVKIGENGEWNLSSDRYRDDRKRHSQFDLLPFDQICTLEYGAALPKEKRIDGEYPVLGSNGITGYHNEYLIEGPAVIVGRKGSVGEVTYIEENCYPIDTTYYVNRISPEKCDIRYLYHVLKTLDLPSLKGGAGIPGLNRKEVYEKHKIPLPPLEVQKEIVAEIEGYQKIIGGARQVIENYQSRISIHPDWPMMELGEVCNIKSGGTPSRDIDEYWNGNIPWVGSTVCKDVAIHEAQEFITQKGIEDSSAKIFPKKTTLIALVGATIGKTGLLEFDCATNQNIAGLYPNKPTELLPDFVFYSAQTLYQEFMKLGEGKFRMANLSFLRSLKIAVPDIETQRAIVAQIETEQRLVNANKELIRIFEDKIKAVINRVWGEIA